MRGSGSEAQLTRALGKLSRFGPVREGEKGKEHPRSPSGGLQSEIGDREKGCQRWLVFV